MPVKKKQFKPKKAIKRIAKKTPIVSGLYDDALPISLKFKGINDNLRPGIRLHKNSQGSISPYIVRLEHQANQISVASQSHEEKIKELAKQLALSLEDETPVLKAPKESIFLSLTTKDLADQFSEPEHIIGKIKLSERFIANTYQPTAMAQIDVETPDVLSIADFKDIAEEPAQPVLNIEIQDTKDHESHKVISSETIIERFSRIHLLLPTQARHRAIAGFLLLSFILVMPLHAMQGIVQTASQKDDITQISQKALGEIENATTSAQNQKFAAASLDFQRASQSFQDAQATLENMNITAAALVNIIPQTDRTFETVQGLVQAGTSLSNAGAQISTAIEELSNADSFELVTKLGLLPTYIKAALPQVKEANLALEKVDISLVPAQYAEKINLLLSTTPSLEASMSEFLTFSDTLQTLLGGQQKMRYLLAFQNNTELRATGGFIGSFAQIDMVDGKIVDISIPEGGTYDLQGQLTEFVAPPQPLSLLNSRWELHDANWLPDFPSSAQKLMWFYEKAGGPTVDGVIAVNATLMPKLLEITGPIDMPEYGRTITSENFLFETQKIVEYEYTAYQDSSEREQDAPKQFIGDLAPKLLEILSTAEPEMLLQVVDLASNSLLQKDVLIYMQDNKLQSDIKALGWSGSLLQTDGDYLMVVDSNLGGGKTDSVIKQDIDVDVEIQADGSIINTVTITKEHTGLANALFEGINNVDYLRLYVPKGSELLQASGFEIPDESLFKIANAPLATDKDLLLWTSNFTQDPISGTDIWNEQGKTVFGNWMQTKPGETEIVTFTYRLPWKYEQETGSLLNKAKSYLGFKNLDSYSMLVQKQPGVETRNTTVQLTNATNQRVLWTSKSDLFSTGSSFDNTQDISLSALFEQF